MTPPSPPVDPPALPAGCGPGLQEIFDEAIAEVVWAGETGGRSLSISGNVARLCGCSTTDMLGSASTVWIDRAHAADRARVEEAYRRLLVTGAPFDEEYRFVRWDGSPVWLRGRLVLRAGAVPAIVEGVFVDATARMRLLAEVHHLQKLEVIGQFTGGIAHDFNNLLAVILAHATMLLDALPDDDPRRGDAVGVFETAERAAALTRQLLPFTRKHSFEPCAVDLSDVVRDAERMLRRVLGSDIAVVTRLAPSLPSVRADAHLLEHVLMNLAANARDAMPAGGTLAIETAAVEGGAVRVTVSDTGCGMDAATRLRVFEPFFTTKRPGEGTGLGLTTSRNIVHQCGGSIRVDSEPGRGAVFELLFPALDEAGSPAADAALAQWRDYRGSERILLVDDDEGVRALVGRMLVAVGYDVHPARDAEEALAAIQTASAPFDLLLSDVILPRSNGAAVSAEVVRRSPATRTLFMSGHSLAWLVERCVLDSGDRFIHKPFTPAALLGRVREVLDA